MFAMGPLQAQKDPQGVWGYDRQSNAIVRMKNPGQTSIGDIRVRYFIPSNRLEQNQSQFLMSGIKAEKDAHKFKSTLSANGNIDFRQFVW